MDDPRRLGEIPPFLTVHALGPTVFGKYGFTRRLTPWLIEHLPEYQCVIINGLWQFHGLAVHKAALRVGHPYFVFPHGMLDPWFKHAYPAKHLKKWLYWPWGEYRVLRDATAVLFTCEEERLLAAKSFWLYSATEKVVPYGIAAPPSDAEALRAVFFAAHPQLRGKRLLLFIGRIHVKKGCDLLIEAFARHAAADPNLHLVIAGPDQTGWKSRLEALAATRGIAERICWPGMLRGDLKWGAFYAAEAMCLPSHQENFGIVVAEALGCGLPVLISNKVNIWREIVEAGGGLVAPDTIEGTDEMLGRWLALDATARAQISKAGRALFERRYTVDAMADELIALAASTV
jgi:glycosyltransferase involved in cell wall biosynthesis